MACYKPLQAFQSVKKKLNGKSSIIFSRSILRTVIGRLFGNSYEKIALPCGSCIGCRIDRSRQWAMRCVHESKFHSQNCFITLTFDNDHLPKDGSLNVRDFQLFMKRLRKEFSPRKVRFFHCGEYGSKHGRPHYHAILFGIDFDDKYLWEVRNGNNLYRSPTLERLWPYGYCSVGSVTFQSAAYVARYIMKKITGDDAKEHYRRFDVTDDGEIVSDFTIKPEYTTMSRKPGIGKAWIDEYMSDVFPQDLVVMRDGKKFRPPKFYDSQFELHNPVAFSKVKEKRKASLKDKKFLKNNTPERLIAREEYKRKTIDKLVRNLG